MIRVVVPGVVAASEGTAFFRAGTTGNANATGRRNQMSPHFPVLRTVLVTDMESADFWVEEQARCGCRHDLLYDYGKDEHV